MSELQVSHGVRAKIAEFIRHIYVDWVKTGKFAKVLKEKTKNGVQKLKPRHIQDVLVHIYHKAKNGIINFVKKVLTAPMTLIRTFVAFMISEVVTSPELQHRLLVKFTSKKIADH